MLEGNRFKATVIQEIGEYVLSENIKQRVLLVKTPEGRFRVSAQVWLLEEGKWQPGRGYFLDGRSAVMIGEYIEHNLPTEILEISNTQQFRFNRDEEGQVVLSKWWRKSKEEDWSLSKSLTIPNNHEKLFAKWIIEAGSKIIFIKN